jgi:hypothetical protein
MQEIYYCNNCGAPVTYGENFCGNCGMTLNWAVQQVPPQPPPPYGYPYPDQQQQAWNQQQQMYNQQQGWDQYPPYGPPPPGYGMPDQSRQAMNAPYGAPPQKKGMSTPIIAMIAIIVLLLVVGGIGIATNGKFFMPSDDKTIPPPETTLPLPVIGSFSAASAEIAKGESTTLSWNISDATSVSINQGIGEVDLSGSKSVSPGNTTTYTITAVNSTGSNTRSITVTVVTATDKPVINSFTVDRTSIISGEYAILEWDISGATSASLNNNIGDVDSTGSKSVFPTTTTKYTITATNSAGSVTKSITITVTAEEPEITSFTATPTTITAGESTELEWVVANATSVSISPGVGTVDEESGTATVNPTSTKTYTITATNTFGSTTGTVKVFVATDVPEITTFTADPEVVTEGDAVTLEWEVEGAVTVYISDEVGNVDPVSGTEEVHPTATLTYTLTATNSFGSVTETVEVTVNEGQPVITSFTATPTTVTSGGSTVIEWDVSGADIVHIDSSTGMGGDVTESGTQTVYPPSTTTYTLTATNSYDEVTATVTVTVTN